LIKPECQKKNKNLLKRKQLRKNKNSNTTIRKLEIMSANGLPLVK